MVQRIQTIYLLLASMLLLAMLYFPLVKYSNGITEYLFNSYGVREISTNSVIGSITVIPMVALTVVIIALICVSVFMYRNRKRQMLMGNLNLLLLTGLVVFIFYYSDKAVDAIGATETNYQPAMVLPFLAMVLIFLAIKAIRKDEALVRSSDRIR